VRRKKPLSVADDATFDAWLRETSGRTIEEFAAAELTNRPIGPPPPPPSTPFRIRPGDIVELGPGEKFALLPLLHLPAAPSAAVTAELRNTA
jgi:hypothetical protein